MKINKIMIRLIFLIAAAFFLLAALIYINFLNEKQLPNKSSKYDNPHIETKTSHF